MHEVYLLSFDELRFCSLCWVYRKSIEELMLWLGCELDRKGSRSHKDLIPKHLH